MDGSQAWIPGQNNPQNVGQGDMDTCMSMHVPMIIHIKKCNNY